MNEEIIESCCRIVSKRYIEQATQGRRKYEKKVRELFDKKKLPKEGWSEFEIETLMTFLSSLDSNNFDSNVGVGEREGRMYCKLVERRHYWMGHGIGRSGDLNAEQPKAAGSSLMLKLCISLSQDALRVCGLRGWKCAIVPAATGVSLSLVMATFKLHRPLSTHVICPRIDQKTCLKCIITAGLIPHIVENVLVGDELCTDIDSVVDSIDNVLTPEKVLCVLSVSSCFAPRAPDKLVEIAKVCHSRDIPHVVNNAYGLQSSKCCHLLSEATRLGRVDAAVSSTDKNFLVPVGGALVYSKNAVFLKEFTAIYPGRANASPVIDLFLTLLSLGANGYKQLLEERKAIQLELIQGLEQVASKHGERRLDTRNNQIGEAISIGNLKKDYATQIGSMLWMRMVSGARAVSCRESKVVAGIELKGWGAHHNSYPYPYLACSAALGTTLSDITIFIRRLDEVLSKNEKERKGGLEKDLDD